MLGAAVGKILPSVLGWGMKKLSNTSWGSKLMDFLSQDPGNILKNSAMVVMNGARQSANARMKRKGIIKSRKVQPRGPPRTVPKRPTKKVKFQDQ